MRAVFETLVRVEDRVLWALVAMILAYLVWGVAAELRGRQRRNAPGGLAEPAPRSSASAREPRDSD